MISKEEKEHSRWMATEMVALSDVIDEVTITPEQYAFLTLADDQDFPANKKLRLIRGSELLHTGYYAQVGNMKIKLR